MKQFVFDIGNVLVDFHPSVYFDQRMPNLSMKEVCPLVFDAVWDCIDCGYLTCDQARKIHLHRYPQYRKQIDLIYDHWKEMMSLKEDTLLFLKAYHQQGHGVYILSNIGAESYAYLKEAYDFFHLVDGMVLSYQEQLLKPNPRIFQVLLTRYGLKPDDCVYFDDRKENVDTALSLGMQGIVFHSMDQAKDEVMIC